MKGSCTLTLAWDAIYTITLITCLTTPDGNLMSCLLRLRHATVVVHGMLTRLPSACHLQAEATDDKGNGKVATEQVHLASAAEKGKGAPELTPEPAQYSPGLPLDPSPLLQQLRLFQDQLQQLATTPAQKPPASSQPHHHTFEQLKHLAQLQQSSTPEALKRGGMLSAQSSYAYGSAAVTKQDGHMDMTTPSGAALA